MEVYSYFTSACRFYFYQVEVVAQVKARKNYYSCNLQISTTSAISNQDSIKKKIDIERKK
jgi:hypothetical protein